MSGLRKLLGSVLRLGCGEAVSKLASFGLYAYISRVFGVEWLGMVALAQTIATYVMMGADQGLRLIGARLVARQPSTAHEVIRHVLKRRITSGLVCVALGAAYAFRGPVPAQARWLIFGVVIAVIPYVFSLDWLAWGLDHFGWLGVWRGGVGLIFATSAILAMHLTRTILLPVTIANGASVLLGAGLLGLLWILRWEPNLARTVPATMRVSLQIEFQWATVFPLGLATIVTLMFNNFDALMLGAMSTARELGRYAAAYKILFVVFSSYYLVTQSLYPRLSRMKNSSTSKRLLVCMFAGAFGGGVVLGGVIAVFASAILRLVYGADLSAVQLLRLLSVAIPMDFCTALAGTILVSQKLDKIVLWGAGSAAACDIALNLWLIPQLGAYGAAWATVISYVVLLIILSTACIYSPLFKSTGNSSGLLEDLSPSI